MSTPTWARIIAKMDRLGYSLAELCQRGSFCYPERRSWYAQFCLKGRRPNGFLSDSGDDPLAALSMAAMKMLEARANTYKYRAEDQSGKRVRKGRVLDAWKEYVRLRYAVRTEAGRLACDRLAGQIGRQP